MRKCLLVLAVAFVVALAGSSAFADFILDQSQISQDAGIRVFSTRSLCQTFTAGMSGELDKVSLWLTDTKDQKFPATISILGTTGDDKIPDDGNVLWTHDYAILAQNWFDVDTSASSVFLTVGVVYGIKVENVDTVVGDPDDVWYVKTTTNPYAAGKLFEKRTGGWVPLTISGVSYPSADAAFKTYIIKEPTMMIMAFLAMSLIFTGSAYRRIFS